MAKLPGLSPVGEDRANLREKGGRTPVRRDTRPQYSLTPTASAVDTYVRPQQAPDDRRLGQLADALSQLNPALENYAGQAAARKEAEQMEQLAFYVEQFSKDREAGAVNSAQVKETFPELVPTVAARIAQSIAGKDAREFAKGRAQAILEDDSIRLNTDARKAAMEEFRAEAMEQIGDNPFYGASYLEAFDSVFAEYESSWMRETAGYHETVQMEEFSTLAAQALANGGDLLALDDQWGQSSSLNNVQRKQAVAQAAINRATETMDPSVLAQVPDRFLNAETKAQFVQTAQAIDRAKHSQWSQRKERAEYGRTLAIRDAQSQVLARLANGEEVNPLEYLALPEVAAFAESWNSKPLLDPVRSKTTAQQLQHGLLISALTGDPASAFRADPQAQQFFEENPMTRDNILEYIATNPDLNPADAAELLGKVDQIAEGQNLMSHPSVKNNMDILDRHARVLEQSIAQQLGGMLNGVSLTADAEMMFQDYVTNGMMEHLAEHGQMPQAFRMAQLAREALNEARTHIEQTASLHKSNAPQPSTGGSSTPAQNNGPAPARTRVWDAASGTFKDAE